jgi:hypothetical protein
MSQINQLFFQNVVDFVSENKTLKSSQKEQIDLVAKAYYTYIIYLDKLFDQEIEINQDSLNTNPLFELTQHHELCIKTLVKLFGEDSTIFESKAVNSKIYFDALVKEKLFDFEQSNFHLNDFEKLAVDKHIPVFFIVDALELLIEDYPTKETKDMLSYIFRGIQMYDDVTDIGEDLQQKQFTYIISKTIHLLKSDDDYYPDNQSYTHKAFFALEELSNPEFDYMVNQFEEAKKIANQLNYSQIENWCTAIIAQVEDWKSQIEDIRNA